MQLYQFMGKDSELACRWQQGFAHPFRRLLPHCAFPRDVVGGRWELDHAAQHLEHSCVPRVMSNKELTAAEYLNYEDTKFSKSRNIGYVDAQNV